MTMQSSQRCSCLLLFALAVHQAVQIPSGSKQCSARTSQPVGVHQLLTHWARESQSQGTPTPVFCYRHDRLDDAETAAVLQAARSAGLVCQIRSRPDSACWLEQHPGQPGNRTAADWMQHVAHWGTLQELWVAASESSLTPSSMESAGWDGALPGLLENKAGLTVHVDLRRHLQHREGWVHLQHREGKIQDPPLSLTTLALPPEEVPYWAALREAQLREERRPYVVHLSWLLAQERLRKVAHLAQSAAMGSGQDERAQKLAASWGPILAMPAPHRISATAVDHFLLDEQNVRVLYDLDIPVLLEVAVSLDSETAASKCALNPEVRYCHAMEGHELGCAPLAVRRGLATYNTASKFDPASRLLAVRPIECWEWAGSATPLCVTARPSWGQYRLHASIVCRGRDSLTDEVLAEGSRTVAFSLPFPMNPRPSMASSMSLTFSPGDRVWSAIILGKGEEDGLAAKLCSTVQASQPEAEASCRQWVRDLIRHEELERYYSIMASMHQFLAVMNPDLVPDRMQGHTGLLTASVNGLHDVVKHPLIETVCEIGTNAGHSSANWLLHGGPNVKVYAFELGQNSYTWTALDYLHQVFSAEKMELIMGDSSKTVPAFVKHHPDIKCNLLFIDGSHTYEAAVRDLSNFRLLVNESFHRIIMDDLDQPGVRLAWDQAEDGGQVETLDVLTGDLEDSDLQFIMWRQTYHTLGWAQYSTDMVLGRYV